MFRFKSNETGGSNNMEKHGLIKCVESIFHKCDLQIQTLVTDRHPQIIKFVRENMKETEHVFDVWHVPLVFNRSSLSFEAFTYMADDYIQCFVG